MSDTLQEALNGILARLETLDARLDRLEAGGTTAERLREQLDHERRARRELAEQVEWLADRLGKVQDEARWLREQRDGPAA